jgi:hypothetical protein
MDKNFQITNYGNAIGYIVKQEQMKNNIYGRLEKYYKLNLTKESDKYFSFMTDMDVNTFLKEKHWCCFSLKTTPVFLYLTEYAGILFCFYITKDKIISVKHNFSKELQKSDTVFECEIAEQQLLISDILVYNGNDTRNMFFHEKLELINNIVDKQYIPDVVLDNYNIKTKDFVEYSQLESFWTKYRQKLDYKHLINGIIFRPIGESTRNIVYNPSKNNWKPICDITVDPTKISKRINPNKNVCFKMYRTKKPDIYHLHLFDGSNERYYDFASIPNKKISKLVMKYFDTGKYIHRYIMVNCNYDKEFKRWIPFQKSSRKNPDDIRDLTFL